jgi:hypothetical protein
MIPASERAKIVHALEKLGYRDRLKNIKTKLFSLFSKESQVEQKTNLDSSVLRKSARISERN